MRGLPAVLVMMLQVVLRSGRAWATVALEDLALPSAFITFGEAERLGRDPAAGSLKLIALGAGCRVEVQEPVPAAMILLVWEGSARQACANMTRLLTTLQGQEPLVTAVLVGVRSFHVSESRALGFEEGEDPARIRLFVSYLLARDFELLSSSLLHKTATVDTDRGPFHALTVSVEYFSFRTLLPATYGLLFVWGTAILWRDRRASQCTPGPTFHMALLLCLFCLGRIVKIALDEQHEYYRSRPQAVGSRIASSILFWTPLALGTAAYTLASTAWASGHWVVDRGIPALRWFFLLQVPFSVLFSVAAQLVPLESFQVFCGLLIATGVVESAMFLVFGARVLRQLSLNARALSVQRSAAQRKLTLFVVQSVVLWLLAAATAVLFMTVPGLLGASPYPLFGVQVLRDLLMVGLVASLFAVMTRTGETRSTRPASARPCSSSGPPRSLPEPPFGEEEMGDFPPPSAFLCEGTKEAPPDAVGLEPHQ